MEPAVYTQTAPQLKRSEGIDTLRAVLALWVLLTHLLPWAVYIQGPEGAPQLLNDIATFLNKLFQSGGETHPAVLTFIVLSGYCIHRTSRLLSEDIPVNFRIRKYAIRRFFRIIPIYLLGITAGVIGFIISSGHDLQRTQALSATQSIDSLGLVEKIFGLSVFIPSLHTLTFEGNAPLHTVMTEIWLYISYPLLLFGIAAHWGMRTLWYFIAAVWLVGTLTITFIPSLQPWWHNGSLAGFLLYWWIGAQAIEPGFTDWLKRHFKTLLGCWLLATVLIVWGQIDSPILAECRKLFFALLTAYMFIKIDHHADNILLKPFAMLGVAGYSIYAFHAPLVYSLLLTGLPWWGVFLTSMIFGALSFLVIERPFTSLGRKLSRF